MNQQNFADVSTMASATRGLRRVFIRDLVLPARIGIHDHEREQTQPVIINVDASVEEAVEGADETKTDTIADVVCYETLTEQIKEVLAEWPYRSGGSSGRRYCLASSGRYAHYSASHKTRKPEAIAEAAGVGVEIERLSRRKPLISQTENA